jgi:hypothetical protein
LIHQLQIEVEEMLKTNKRYFLKGITLLYIEEIKETTDVEDD